MSDYILLATNGDISAINSRSPTVHINLEKVGEGTMVVNQPCPIKNNVLKKCYPQREKLMSSSGGPKSL